MDFFSTFTEQDPTDSTGCHKLRYRHMVCASQSLCNPFPDHVQCHEQIVKELKERDGRDKIQDRDQERRSRDRCMMDSGLPRPSGLVSLEHLQIETTQTRLIDERFESVMGECVI